MGAQPYRATIRPGRPPHPTNDAEHRRRPTRCVSVCAGASLGGLPRA